MSAVQINILLADDDRDDCDLFREALDELPVSANFATVHDGEQLMQLLTQQETALPDLVFLDLNMPRKNGFEALSEIKGNESLKHLPVIIFSTSFDRDIVNLLYKKGARHYICKPNHFNKLKNVIQHALSSVGGTTSIDITRENFVLPS